MQQLQSIYETALQKTCTKNDAGFNRFIRRVTYCDAKLNNYLDIFILQASKSRDIYLILLSVWIKPNLK